MGGVVGMEVVVMEVVVMEVHTVVMEVHTPRPPNTRSTRLLVWRLR
jgi:hypothetical protein